MGIASALNSPQPQSQPLPDATADSKPADPPATSPADLTDPSATAILLQLQAAGEEYPRIRAGVEFHELLTELGDESTRTGWVAYQAAEGDSPAEFRIHFDRLRLGQGKWRKEPVDYAFDGHWISVAKHNVKDMQHYQVVAEGEHAQPLKLGKGPFPVPFGQRADDVLKFCEVSTRPPQAGDPENTDYLLCVTRRERRDEVNFRRLEMWVDRSTHLPVRIVSADAEKNIVTVTFSDIVAGKATDKPFDADVFHFADGQFGPGWTSSRHPMEGGSNLMP